MTIWPDLISGMCGRSSVVGNDQIPRRSSVSPTSLPASTLMRRSSDRHTDSRRRRCTWPPPDRDAYQRLSFLTTTGLSAGKAKRCENQARGGAQLVSYGVPRASRLRIVDPDTRMENPPGAIGEIWVHGDNVAMGYWRKDQQTERTFGGKLADPLPGTPEGRWLRTGDLGVIFDDELFITGRIKDLLVVYGSNHYPDDIEATIQEITGGRVVAIAVPGDAY